MHREKIGTLSLDDGKTWPQVRKVDAQVGGYMPLAQPTNGVFYQVGSRLHAARNDAWLREGRPMDAVRLPRTISTPGLTRWAGSEGEFP